MSPLRPISHPGQADTLVHFCGRARQEVAPEVSFMTPQERLGNIVAEGSFRAFPTFGNPNKVVCFSESGPDGVAALLGRLHFQVWGIVVRRDWAWAQGGGPVWCVRDDAWPSLRTSVAPEMFTWMVRTSPGDADWLHEREWRIPCPSGWLEVDSSGVVAILVSDADWESNGEYFDSRHDPATGGSVFYEVLPELATNTPRWLWSGGNITLLPPLAQRIEATQIPDL